MKAGTSTVNSLGDVRVRRAALLASTLSSALTSFTGSSVNIALPSIGREFAMDAVLLSWVATAYLLAAAMFLVPLGRLADIRGRKRVFTVGIICFTVFSILSSTATSAVWLIGFRIGAGIGSAMIFGTAVAILTSVYPPGERGKVLGINSASVYTGLSLGPFLGGLLTQHFGWRSVFFASVPVGLVAIVIVLTRLKGEWAGARGEGFDLPGSAIYGLSVVAGMYGFSLLPSAAGGWFIMAGAAGLAAFVWWELRARNPVLSMDLFRNNTVFALSSLAALINYGATFAVGFLVSLYLQYIKALSPQSAGLVLLSQPVMMAAVSPLAGRLSDRIEPRIVASMGMGLTATSLFLLSSLAEKTAVELIVANLALLGLGLALFTSPNTNAIMSSVEHRFYGVASATTGTMRLGGQMLSMGIAMLMFALYMGKVQITPEFYSAFLASIKTVITIFAVLCCLGILASLARGRVRRGETRASN